MSKPYEKSIGQDHSHDSIENNNLVSFAGPEQIVYEGSKVFLEGISFPPNQKLIWKQVEGPKVDLKYENNDDKNTKLNNPYFKAPFVALDFDKEVGSTTDSNIKRNNMKPFIKLTFELTAKHPSETLSSKSSTVNIIVKMVQRALVFQGGGSLGAYEAGVFKALCEVLVEKDNKIEAKKNRPLFDVIAGSSIGAVNAAIIVDSIKKRLKDNKDNNDKGSLSSNTVTNTTTTALKQQSKLIWKDVANELDRFWNEISHSTWWLDNDFFNMWWDNWNKITKTNIQSYISILNENEKIFSSGGKNNNQTSFSPLHFYNPENMTPVASAESARRYFSWIYFLFSGVPNVMSPNFQQPDTKFFLGIPSFARFDNTPLTKTIKRYWDYEKYPIKTQFEKGEPRLLLVSVDVMDAASAVTFDSYTCKTKYTDSITLDKKDGNDNDFKYIIEYSEGISIEHVNASMSPHLRYQYPKFKAYSERERKHIDRYFWDGAYLSNTPLKELIQVHRDYWYEDGNDERKHVPHLEVYIVNLYPTVEKNNELPKDANTIEDREMDIRFHDRTQYDIKVAQLISDYIILYGQVKNLAIKHLEKLGHNKSKEFLEDLQEILNKKIPEGQKNIGRRIATHKKENKQKEEYEYSNNNNDDFQSNPIKKYKDIIEGRFDIAKVVYIDRKDDGNTIFGKAAEFSTKTITKLKEDGYKEALKEIENI
jgi:NTE family protein